MKFELQPGEQRLGYDEVELVENRRTYPATLILTTNRAVLVYAKTPPVWLWAFAWMIALFAKVAAHAQEQVRHQIRRDRFASVEQGDGGILVFRDTGEGYAHTSFAVKSHKPIAYWETRMQRWVEADDLVDDVHDDDDDDDDGDDDRRAELPRARIVDR